MVFESTPIDCPLLWGIWWQLTILTYYAWRRIKRGFSKIIWSWKTNSCSDLQHLLYSTQWITSSYHLTPWWNSFYHCHHWTYNPYRLENDFRSWQKIKRSKTLCSFGYHCNFWMPLQAYQYIHLFSAHLTSSDQSSRHLTKKHFFAIGITNSPRHDNPPVTTNNRWEDDLSNGFLERKRNQSNAWSETLQNTNMMDVTYKLKCLIHKSSVYF